jgi:glycosyltransferase involved in cell wall biosynthesis
MNETIPLATKRIWIDGQCLQTSSNSQGIGRYVAELLRAIHARGDAQLVVSFNANLADEAIAARRFLEHLIPDVEIHVWFGTAWEKEETSGFCNSRQADGRILVDHVNALKPDIALSPSLFEGFSDLSSPLVDIKGLECATACIFHDAIPHRFPERYFYCPEVTAGYYRRLVAIGQFDFVLCNSEFTAKELADILGRDDGVPIAGGLAATFIEALAIPDEHVVMETSLSTSYILYVGGMVWQKNIRTLISAVALLPAVQSGDLSLVLIGGSQDKYELASLRTQWESLGLPSRGLVVTGTVTDPQLVKYYRHASLAVQPPLMEGFSLSTLEAMALECPLLAAQGGATTEVVVNPDQIFDDANAKEVARLIEKVLTDADFRASIVTAGKQRAPLFQWSRSADIVMTAIARELSGEGGARKQQSRQLPPPPRIVMDVTSTAQNPMNSGIQRVLRRLSAAMTRRDQGAPTVLSYSNDQSGWYKIAAAFPHAISRSPLDRIDHGAGDTYLMLDSSWNLPHIHRPRLKDALVLGQQVVHGVHDIGPLTMPAMTVPGMPAEFANWFKFILGYSTGIVCVSRATADEVYRMICAIKLPRPMKIGYVQLGADFTDGLADDTWISQVDGSPIFLMVGTLEPRKGHALVLDAFDRHWAAGGQARLMLIGKSGWSARLLELRLRHHPELGRKLLVHTDVTDEQLRGAYATAQALIMASYLEGFGLPVVEAGRLGCPVILSDLPVFREVAEGAGQADFFQSGDVEGLLECIERSLAQGQRNHAPVSVNWPDWHGTAQQVHDIMFGDLWYKTYQPEYISVDALPAKIGGTRMLRALDDKDQRYSIRYIDGPMLTDDGAGIQISVAIRNEGDALWTSTSSPDGGLHIDVASNIIDGKGAVVDTENLRYPIPFVMPPGQEFVFPIRVSTDWLARGAHAADVGMVQESVGHFGKPARFALNQRPTSAITDSTSSLTDTRIDVLRYPWAVPGVKGRHLLLAVSNIGAFPIQASSESIAEQIEIRYGGIHASPPWQFSIASSFDMILSGQIGLLTLTLPEDACQFARDIHILLGGRAGASLTITL